MNAERLREFPADRPAGRHLEREGESVFTDKYAETIKALQEPDKEGFEVSPELLQSFLELRNPKIFERFLPGSAEHERMLNRTLDTFVSHACSLLMLDKEAAELERKSAGVVDIQSNQHTEHNPTATEIAEKIRTIIKLQSDPVTGLFSRAFILQSLMEKRSGTENKEKKQLAVVCLDLDGFKKINDVAGHPAGDEVLRGIANLIKGLVRRDDYVVRMGGDEFAIYAEVGNVASVQALANGILERIKSSQKDLFGVGASIGYAIQDGGELPEDTYKRADAAQKDAKQGGKGRVRGYGEPEPELALVDEPEIDRREAEKTYYPLGFNQGMLDEQLLAEGKKPQTIA